MVNVGTFNSSIKIVRLETGYDDMGFESEVEVVKHTLRCEYQSLTGKEFYSNNNLQGEVIAKFLCRKRKVDQLKDYVIFDGQRYDITFVQPIERDYMKLHTKIKVR